MSTQEKPILWKWYLLKAVIAALVLFVGYKVFVDKPTRSPIYSHRMNSTA